MSTLDELIHYAGHADERTTYFNYCYDRTPDAEKKQLLEKALA